ncbi:hypothetical protein Ddc_05806 [Ditylenchus destructor]|nr:hypothetical protein Ddc_05806 [Ditylenchus destructor]
MDEPSQTVSVNTFISSLSFFCTLIYPLTAAQKKLVKLISNKQLSADDFSNEFLKFNLTKRPLNLYIIANGKHSVVLNKSLEKDGPIHDNNRPGDYRISHPPFSIKNRGVVIILHNSTGNHGSLDWHFGYPSVIQMLAASGHTTIAPEIAPSSGVTVNSKLIENILKDANKTENFIIIANGPTSAAIVSEYLRNAGNQDAVDGVVLIGPGKSAEYLGKFHCKPNSLKATLDNNETCPIVIIEESVQGNDFVKHDALYKTVAVSNPNSLHSQQNVTQVIVNFLDWIHPR